MRVIRNLTVRPVRVPLPQGKVLHLGPRKEGQVGDHDVDHKPLQQLVERGEIEILGEGAAFGGRSKSGVTHEDIHGHHPRNTVKRRGNR